MTFPFAWLTGPTGFHGGCSLGPTDSAVQATIKINYSDLNTACRQVLGFAAQKPPPEQTKLQRFHALPHPQFGWMRCTRIANWRFSKQQGKTTGAFGTYMTYKYALLDLVFSVHRFDIKTDAQAWIDGEWTRYVIRETKSVTTAMSREHGAYTFKNAAPVPAALRTQDVKGNVSQQVQKTRLRWKWIGVPEIGLVDAFGFATNLFATVGKVNDATFWGRPAGTLLMEDPDIEPVEVANFPSIITGANGAYTLPRAYNVHVNMLYFNPDNDGGSVFGHNLAPDPANTGKWYELVAKRDGTSLPYASASFPTAFNMV